MTATIDAVRIHTWTRRCCARVVLTTPEHMGLEQELLSNTR
jgi:hypothetical protein